MRPRGLVAILGEKSIGGSPAQLSDRGNAHRYEVSFDARPKPTKGG